MPLRSRVLIAAVVAVPLALVTACSGSGTPVSPGTPSGQGGSIPSAPAPGPQSLSEAGSTLLQPLMSTWAAAYRGQHPNVTIKTAGGGSKDGIAFAAAGRVNIGAFDAYLSSGTLVQHPALLNIPLAVSAPQINYNLPGVANLKLNAKVLAEMYQDIITTWNNPKIAALNHGVRLPSTRVVPVHRSDGSGDTFLFTSYLSTHDSVWNHNCGYGTTVNWPAVPVSPTPDTGTPAQYLTTVQFQPLPKSIVSLSDAQIAKIG